MKSNITGTGVLTALALFSGFFILLSSPGSAEKADIRKLNQHFNQPGAETSPWMFAPESNVKEVSTREIRGLATIRQAGRGQDVKGILKEPIRVDDFPLPWEFQMALVQNYCATFYGAGDPKQANYAIGLNVAVTFSDPATWPEDRARRPPDTHDFQLFVVHLGSTSEFSEGLPQYQLYPYRPETFVVWGRGDLSDSLAGDWKIPYIYTGALPANAGPAAHEDFFRVVLNSPTSISVGIKFEASLDFDMRVIDCSRFGKITGVWEIGPIFSCDRWIPDELSRQLPPTRKVENPPELVPPNPVYPFYVDYCTFQQCYPAAPLEHYSDDFNIQGYLGQWRGFQIPFAAETWSNPGYLSITMLGASQGVWFGPSTLLSIDFQHYPPPWEMEICFIPPDDALPWNLFVTQQLLDKKGRLSGYWQPCVRNNPAEGRHCYANFSHAGSDIFQVNRDAYLKKMKAVEGTGFGSKVDLKFNPEVPESILAGRPLYMLYQMLDDRHARIGFKARASDDWYLSKPYDFSKIIDGGLGGIGELCWGTSIGREMGRPDGSAMYQRLLVDYVHYRQGLSRGEK